MRASCLFAISFVSVAFALQLILPDICHASRVTSPESRVLHHKSRVPSPGLYASARAPKKEAQFEGTAAWEKADLRLRMAWRDAMSEGKGDAVFECLIKTTRPLLADDMAILKAAGFNYRTTIGDIATGNLKASDVPSVAALEIVKAMELAVPLKPARLKASKEKP